MTSLLLGFAQIALLVVGNPGGPAAVGEPQPSIEQVRLVCDQHCTCWRTLYQQRQPIREDREDLGREDFLACPSRRNQHLYYNGYYRKGPATGLGFESRYTVREFPFPF